MITRDANRAGATARSSLIEYGRLFNTTLDNLFYNTPGLSAKEREPLVNYRCAEGGLLIVHPRRAGRSIRPLKAEEFVDEQRDAGRRNGSAVRTIVIAGVGSSALGTACLARDVADHLDEPVAGIVSGYGLADLLTEALGGWFALGATNAARDLFASIIDLFSDKLPSSWGADALKDHVRHQSTHAAIAEHFARTGISRRFLYGSPDSTALLYILSSLGSRIELLVGHSKGNYSIENALEGLRQQEKPLRAAGDRPLHIVTLSAVIWFPAAFSGVNQVIGQIDLFGFLNSRPNLEFISVPGAWHSTNSMLPGHLSVSEAMALAGVRKSRDRRSPLVVPSQRTRALAAMGTDPFAPSGLRPPMDIRLFNGRVAAPALAPPRRSNASPRNGARSRLAL
jgi:hypothetical protein